jgi:hypothetical protein
MQEPQAMRERREIEHPFGTLKLRMGATHLLIKRSPRSLPRWRCTSWPTISHGFINILGCCAAIGRDRKHSQRPRKRRASFPRLLLIFSAKVL